MGPGLTHGDPRGAEPEVPSEPPWWENRQIQLPGTWQARVVSGATMKRGLAGLTDECWAQPDDKLLRDKSRSCSITPAAQHLTTDGLYFLPHGREGGLLGEPCPPAGTWQPTSPWRPHPRSKGTGGVGSISAHLQGRAGRTCLARSGKILCKEGETRASPHGKQYWAGEATRNIADGVAPVC